MADYRSAHDKVLQEIHDIDVAKEHDYGGSFYSLTDRFGLFASVPRLNDKLSRFETLISKEAQVKDESIRDTLIDMANYCIKTVAWMDARKGLSE